MNIRVLNLYAGIGGNRKLWEGVEVTAVENDKGVANCYHQFFPDDILVIDDAHKYLLEHYKEFDFIWSSPPCPSHSHIRKELGVEASGQNEPIYPDMKLYEEILFLQGYAKCKWVVENVMSWYKPLVKPFESGDHYFWANFIIPKLNTKNRSHMGSIAELEKRKGFTLRNAQYYKLNKRKALRNCVEPEVGLSVFDAAFRHQQVKLV